MVDELAWVVSTARQRDPSLEQSTAELLAAEALPLARAQTDLDSAAVARELLAGHPETDPSNANAVASAAVDLLEQG